MPTLNWLTRDKDLIGAMKTEYRLLTENTELGYGSCDTENMLIEGDNLEALRALLPFYAGQVKCIYIDPPYNTGYAFEHYDDNLEHSKWLAMMYPRLELLREFLAEDGSIWISIDADESHYLKVVCDEVFGRRNFVDEVIWQRAYAPINLKKTLSRSHDTVLVYAKNFDNSFELNKIQRRDKHRGMYKNYDNDTRGDWKSDNLSVGPAVEKNIYPITTPSGRICYPPEGYSWRLSEERLKEFIEDNRIWFGINGNNVPSIKRFLSEVKDGVTCMTLWTYEDVGHNQDAKKEIKTLFENNVFTTPKPEKLIQRILTLATNKNDLVLDSFLGSGTTTAVAQKMGRRYIGIEMGEQARTHCAVRLRKVIDGEQGGISKTVGWTGGGGFRFFTLGNTVFDGEGRINANITFANLAAHVWFSETKTPWNNPSKDAMRSQPVVLGVHKNVAYALLYNGVLHDRRVNGGNVLTCKTLEIIKDDLQGQDYERVVIYGESARLGVARLKSEKIEFKQTPYDIKKR